MTNIKKLETQRVKDENAIENKINEVNRKQLTATEKYSMIILKMNYTQS